MQKQLPTKYTLENLHEEFARHAEEQEKQIEDDIVKFKELNPNGELPDLVRNPFNLAWALKVITLELKNLNIDYYSSNENFPAYKMVVGFESTK